MGKTKEDPLQLLMPIVERLKGWQAGLGGSGQALGAASKTDENAKKEWGANLDFHLSRLEARGEEAVLGLCNMNTVVEG